MAPQNETPAAAGTAGRGDDSGFGNHSNSTGADRPPQVVHWVMTPAICHGRRRMVAILAGGYVAHASEFPGFWRVFVGGNREPAADQEIAWRMLRDAVAAAGGAP